MTETTSQTGRIIGGRYRIDDPIGTRRFETYRALNLDTDTEVCVAFGPCVMAGDAGARFRREARVLRRLQHEHIADILDFGQTEQGVAFVVRPHFAGTSLSRVVAGQPMDVQVVGRLIAQIASALEFAHGFGVYHRALDVSSVVIVNGDVRITDFMESRWHKVDLRTPPPLPAGPARPNEGADAAGDDVYRIGVLASECLGLSNPSLQTLPEEPAAAELARLVRRCIGSLDGEERLTSCTQLLADLDAWQRLARNTQRLSAIRPQRSFPRRDEILAGRYRIEEVIGEGAFARVFRATTTDTHQQVALKVLRPDRTSDAAVAMRFVREGKLVFSLLTNPHTISVYGYGETEDGMLFIAFEFVDGVSLSSLIGEETLGPERVVRILEQCLVSLAEAHGMGVLHRDIKPSNIMLSHRDGVEDWVTIVDFGMAKITSDVIDKAELTRAGRAVGTPRYMAPEQIAGEPLGPESDLYSLGLVATELLTGEPAVRGDNVLEVLTAQLDPQSVILSAPNVPGALSVVINRMIRKDRAQRYRGAHEVLRDLRDLHRAVGDKTVDTSAR